jgi:hypothetical protein
VCIYLCVSTNVAVNTPLVLLFSFNIIVRSCNPTVAICPLLATHTFVRTPRHFHQHYIYYYYNYILLRLLHISWPDLTWPYLTISTTTDTAAGITGMCYVPTTYIFIQRHTSTRFTSICAFWGILIDELSLKIVVAHVRTITFFNVND